MVAETGDYADRIQWIMDTLGCASQKEFAQRIGVSVESVSRWMNKPKPPSRSSQAAMARELRVPAGEVFALFKRGEPIKSKPAANGARKPVAAPAQPNGMIPHFETCAKIAATWETGREELQLTAADADEWVYNLTPYPASETFSVTVEGDSMEPDFPDGSRVMASKAAEPQSGKPHLVFGVEDNKCLLRIAEWDDDHEFITLRPLNWRKYQSRTYQWRESSIRVVRVLIKWQPV